MGDQAGKVSVSASEQEGFESRLSLWTILLAEIRKNIET